MVQTESFPINANTALHRKVFSPIATERTTAGGWTDTATTFTLTHPVGSLIQGFRIKYQSKNAGGGACGVRVKMTGATLTTSYIETATNEATAGITNDAEKVISTTDNGVTGGLTYTNDAGYLTSEMVVPCLFKVPDSQTVFTFQIATNGAGTSYLSNVELDVLYVEAGWTED